MRADILMPDDIQVLADSDPRKKKARNAMKRAKNKQKKKVSISS